MPSYRKDSHRLTPTLFCEFCSKDVCMFCMYGKARHVCIKCDRKSVTVKNAIVIKVLVTQGFNPSTQETEVGGSL